MWRTFLISMAFLTNALVGCDPGALIVGSGDPGAYEVVALVAE